jgi:lipopolysaccharide transport system permease protein
LLEPNQQKEEGTMDSVADYLETPATTAALEYAGPEPAALAETVIERRAGWQLLDWRELWRYRELLYFLAWRDVKLRYKQTVLGLAWALIQPLGTMLAFTLFLGPVAGASSSQTPYALFVYAGLLPWFFFANGITAAGQSIVSNQNLVTKVYFPRLAIPLAAVGVGVLDFLVGLGLLAVLMVANGVAPGPRIAWLPLIALALAITTVGVGTLLAALTVPEATSQSKVWTLIVFFLNSPLILVPFTVKCCEQRRIAVKGCHQ